MHFVCYLESNFRGATPQFCSVVPHGRLPVRHDFGIPQMNKLEYAAVELSHRASG